MGRGGMGVVYKARQTGLNRLVALKMLLPDAAGDAEERVRFRREAEAVAHLKHPHIVEIHEVGEQAGRPHFALEFVAGGTLAEKLAGLPQPARAAALLETLARTMYWGSPAGYPASRPEAGQCPADCRRHAQDQRLRTGQALDKGRPPDADGASPGHALLHGSGAGRGPGQDGRPGGRRVARWGRSSTSA